MSEFAIIILYGLVQASIYTLVALGLTLTFGVTRILNFAHGQFVTVGAFITILWAPSIGFWLAALLSVAACLVIAAISYFGAFRFVVGNDLQGLALSLGILLILQNYMISHYTTDPRQGPTLNGYVLLLNHQVAKSQLIVLALLVPLVPLMWLGLRKTWWGLSMRACSADEFAASTLGMSVRRVGLYAFVVSGALAAIAGTAIASVEPITPLVGSDLLLNAFVVVIIGGLGSPFGALLGAVLLGVVTSLGTRYFNPALTGAYGFVLVILILMIAPQGLLGRRTSRV